MSLDTLDEFTANDDLTTMRAVPSREVLEAEIARLVDLLGRLPSHEGRSTHTTRRQRPVEGWDSLTDTERRVARFVSEGLTNVQVGKSMFLSRHTVDFHLRHIFRKLNVHSRVELTRHVLEFSS
jgi:DNA-binding CsgD family transcriptional regulator